MGVRRAERNGVAKEMRARILLTRGQDVVTVLVQTAGAVRVLRGDAEIGDLAHLQEIADVDVFRLQHFGH